MKTKLLILFVTSLLVGCSELMQLSTNESVSSNIETDYSHLLEDKGEYYLLGGDIALHKDDPNHQRMIASIIEGNSNVRSLTMLSNRYWDIHGLGVIHYNYTYNMSSEQILQVEKAIDILERTCGVQFVRKSSGGQHIYRVSMSDKNYGWSTPGEAHNSYVYLAGGEDRTGIPSIRHIIHEFMHGLGFMHEHQRPDARSYTNFYRDNLYDDYFASQFAPLPPLYYDTMGSPYDYKSIMHYGAGAFAQEGTVTLQAINGSEVGGDRLSEYDKRALQKAYGPSKLEQTTFYGNFVTSGPNNPNSRRERVVINNKSLQIFDPDGSPRLGSSELGYVSGDSIRNYYRQRENTWTFNFSEDRFIQGDFDGNGRSDLLVHSSTGLAIMSMYGLDQLKTHVYLPNGTYAGRIQLTHGEYEIIKVANFDDEVGDEILVKNRWGIGILKFDKETRRLDGSISAHYSKRFPRLGSRHYWFLGDSDEFVGFGNYDNDPSGKFEMIIQDDWGLSIVTIRNGYFYTLVTEPYGGSFSGWGWYAGQEIITSGNFDGIPGDEILVKSNWGMALLKISGNTLRCIWGRAHAELQNEMSGLCNNFEEQASLRADNSIGGASKVIDVFDLDRDGFDEILIQEGRWSSGQEPEYKYDVLHYDNRGSFSVHQNVLPYGDYVNIRSNDTSSNSTNVGIAIGFKLNKYYWYRNSFRYFFSYH